jgi:hypothetical protein
MAEYAPICETCKFWERLPENQRLGVCSRLGVMQFGEKASISVSIMGSKPISDFEAVRTRANFGCRFHSSLKGMEFATD